MSTAAPNDVVLIHEHNGKKSFHMRCPGCADVHVVNESWEFNGDTVKPSFSPSILVTRTPTIIVEGGPVATRCHSFLTDGVWNYLGDCSHDMAGQSVPAVPWPYGDGA